jgi:hypothetical protein
VHRSSGSCSTNLYLCISMSPFASCFTKVEYSSNQPPVIALDLAMILQYLTRETWLVTLLILKLRAALDTGSFKTIEALTGERMAMLSFASRQNMIMLSLAHEIVSI